MLEALCRQSSTTLLDIVHAEDGPPITQRTSGLGILVLKTDGYGPLIELSIWSLSADSHFRP